MVFVRQNQAKAKEDDFMDDYQDEILERHASEQDGPEPADDAFEL